MMVRSFAALIFAACAGSDGGTTAGFTRTDSAGFTIAVNMVSMSALKPVFTVDSAPRLRIGVEAGEESLQFTEIRGVARLDDGRIAVANGRPPQVRIFSPEGTFLAAVGSHGQGPGEFQSLGSLGVATGDTLFVVDPQYFRMLRYTVGGGYVGMTTASPDRVEPALAPMHWAEGMQEMLRNGAIVVTAQPPTDGALDGSQFPTGELFRRQTKLVWISPDYSRSVVVGDQFGIQQMFIDMGGGRREAVIPPGSRWQRSDVGRRGTRVCTAHNETPEVRCVDQDGQVLIIRWNQDDVPTSKEAIERWRENMRFRAARASSPDAAPQAERIISGIVIPPTMPPVTSLFVDASGRVLVRTPDLVSPPGWSRARVFSAEGELIGIADLPLVTPHEVGEDHLLGQWRNEDGVEFVVIHDVRRR